MDVTASGGSVMTLSGGFSATSATAFTLKGSGTLTPKSSFSLNVNGGYLSAKTDVGKTILVPNSGSETFAGVARRPK
jgi:hypothetical protein